MYSINHYVAQDAGSEEESSGETLSSVEEEEEEEDGEFTANEEDGKITLQIKMLIRLFS